MSSRPGRGRAGNLVAAAGWAAIAVAAASCGSDRYIIGRYDAGAGAGGAPGDDGGAAGGGGAVAPACTAGVSCRFSVDLDRSGVGQLPDVLDLPAGALASVLRYRGERAAADGWHADHGPLLTPAIGTTTRDLATPFTDATLAVGLGTDAASFQAPSVGAGSDAGAVAAGDFVVELVFRAAPGVAIVGKGASSAGWSLGTGAGGVLLLALGDGAATVQVPSEALARRAWYHCLAWVSRGHGARIDCDGRAGVLRDLSGVGDLTAAAPLALGGAAGGITDGVQLALLQLFVAAPGALGDPAGWQAASHRRFALLTGVFPRLATGSALPKEGLRDSLAYVDLQRESGGPRRLFLVGADWPRIACRTDSAGTWDCGYLSEPARSQVIDPQPAQWTAAELTLTAGDVVFVDGDGRMPGLVASASAAAHTLSQRGGFGGPRQSLSLFAHAGAGHLLGVQVAAHGRAVFDVETGAVTAAPAGATASIEDWGHGVFRCLYTFDVEGGALDYRLSLLDDSGAELFAGDGTRAWLSLGGLQLDVNQAGAGSLLAVDRQAADHLTYATDDGNLPTGPVALDLRVLLPPGRRLTDQAIININRAATYDDQIDLFVQGKNGNFEFWGLSGGGTSWSFTHSTTALDGVRHAVAVQWGGATSQVSVDGVPVSKAASRTVGPPVGVDRLDVGFSLHSSGHLQGLLAGLQIRGL